MRSRQRPKEKVAPNERSAINGVLYMDEKTGSAGKRWRDVGLGLTKVFSGESHKR